MSIWKWLDDNGRFRAWLFGILCGGFCTLIVSMILILVPIINKSLIIELDSCGPCYEKVIKFMREENESQRTT